MHLVPPPPGKRKYDLRFRNHNGKLVKVSGDEDRTVAIRIGNRIDMLIKAKHQGDPPPGELATWIDNMPATLSARLIELGLLASRHVERNKPLSEHIDTFESNVGVRGSNKAKQGKHQAGRVRIVCEALKATKFSDLTSDGLLHYLAEREMATSTRRAYIIVMNDFAKEMVRLGGAAKNPFEHIQPPGQYENPEYERQPLTVKQFRLLMTHMDTFTRYRHQKCKWTAHDRKIIYWTAVKTAYRQSELRALKKANFYLDETPAVVSLKARHAKNKTEGEIAIPSDLAKALKEYLTDLNPNDRVFPFPKTSGSIVDTMRKDLKGAGIPSRLPTGEIVDFHTLRATAITWWLDEDKLSPKRVQVLARLKTLALVYKYSRNLRLEDFSWLESGPKLVTAKDEAGVTPPGGAEPTPNG
jgi:integrase